MIIDLKEIRKRGKTEEDFFFEYVPEGQLVSIPNVALVPPVKVLGKIVLTGRNSALVEAEISFTLAGECTKCLSQTEKSFAVSMAEEFSSDGAEGAYEYRSDKVDLTKAVDDKLILEMPMSFVCSEDCKGIKI